MQNQPAAVVIADAAYNADHIRAALVAKQAEAVIPGSPFVIGNQQPRVQARINQGEEKLPLISIWRGRSRVSKPFGCDTDDIRG